MKKYKQFFRFTFLIFLLEVAGILVVTSPDLWEPSVHNFRKLSTALLAFWFCGTVYLLIRKGNLKDLTARILKICNIALSCVLLVFSVLCILAFQRPYQGGFSATSALFDQKNIMIVVPHQDDDINLLGGLIEQYTDGGSDVTVVFSTNGDRYAESEIRAAEAVQVLTTLGVRKENIYYLGYGDQWTPQVSGDTQTGHIYNSADPDLVWTSLYGATATYGTESIDCYLELPYTRNNYVYSFQSILQEKLPEIIFAVDFDSHVDHKATDLFFEEALCNVLTLHPDYHPTVYKGFCYGTAWHAVDDYYDDLNLLSTKMPEDSIWSNASYGYRWEDRVRFPVSETNLNIMLSKNSVYRSLAQYESQGAALQATRILNGDKVFWERRTDSLLYGAQIFVGGEQTHLLNDFKHKDFDAIADEDCQNSGFIPLHNQTVTIRLEEAVTMNRIYLYDNPDADANILAGCITFCDGSRVEFSALEKDGSATVLTFPETRTDRLEITVTASDSESAGLSEIEAFYDTARAEETDSFLMAVDSDDNFVYDYLLCGEDTVSLQVRSLPDNTPVSAADIALSFEPDGAGTSCSREGDVLVVRCEKGAECTVTVSDSISATTFTVSNPTGMEYAYMQTLRFAERTVLNIRSLLFIIVELLDYVAEVYLADIFA